MFRERTKLREYKHYIFDVDLTLFDTTKGMHKCYRHGLESIGRIYRPELLPYLAKESFELSAKRFGMSASEFKTFEAEFESASRKFMTRNAEIYPDVIETLEALKHANKRLSIVTGKPKPRALGLLKKANIDTYFDDIIGYGQYRHEKPSPEPIEVCLSHTDIPKRDSVYIGDSPNDRLAADRAGIDSYLICRDKSGKETYTMRNLSGIINTLASVSEALVA